MRVWAQVWPNTWQREKPLCLKYGTRIRIRMSNIQETVSEGSKISVLLLKNKSGPKNASVNTFISFMTDVCWHVLVCLAWCRSWKIRRESTYQPFWLPSEKCDSTPRVHIVIFFDRKSAGVIWTLYTKKSCVSMTVFCFYDNNVLKSHYYYLPNDWLPEKKWPWQHQHLSEKSKTFKLGAVTQKWHSALK